MARPSWIKLWTEEWLDGSIRHDLDSAERGLWADLLALAGRSRNPGIIQSNDTTPHPLDYLAGRFRVSLELLLPTLKKLQDQQRIVVDSAGVHILNFAEYQTLRDQRVIKKREANLGKSEPLVGVFLDTVNKEVFAGKLTKQNRFSCLKAVKSSLAMIEGEGEEKIETLMACLRAMLEDPFWGSGRQLQAIRSLPNHLSSYLVLKAEGREGEFLKKGNKKMKGGEIGKRPGEYTPKW